MTSRAALLREWCWRGIIAIALSLGGVAEPSQGQRVGSAMSDASQDAGFSRDLHMGIPPNILDRLNGCIRL